ncbi:mucin-6-like, partial [Penaeus vannamei]|uniref:mucin-6-like n=1 Tax=Penaeus vannamei TaxID=6689 RepID=UPI00387FA802
TVSDVTGALKKETINSTSRDVNECVSLSSETLNHRQFAIFVDPNTETITEDNKLKRGDKTAKICGFPLAVTSRRLTAGWSINYRSALSWQIRELTYNVDIGCGYNVLDLHLYCHLTQSAFSDLALLHQSASLPGPLSTSQHSLTCTHFFTPVSILCCSSPPPSAFSDLAHSSTSRILDLDHSHQSDPLTCPPHHTTAHQPSPTTWTLSPHISDLDHLFHQSLPDLDTSSSILDLHHLPPVTSTGSSAPPHISHRSTGTPPHHAIFTSPPRTLTAHLPASHRSLLTGTLLTITPAHSPPSAFYLHRLHTAFYLAPLPSHPPAHPSHISDLAPLLPHSYPPLSTYLFTHQSAFSDLAPPLHHPLTWHHSPPVSILCLHPSHLSCTPSHHSTDLPTSSPSASPASSAHSHQQFSPHLYRHSHTALTYTSTAHSHLHAYSPPTVSFPTLLSPSTSQHLTWHPLSTSQHPDLDHLFHQSASLTWTTLPPVSISTWQPLFPPSAFSDLADSSSPQSAFSDLADSSSYQSAFSDLALASLHQSVFCDLVPYSSHQSELCDLEPNPSHHSTFSDLAASSSRHLASSDLPPSSSRLAAFSDPSHGSSHHSVFFDLTAGSSYQSASSNLLTSSSHQSAFSDLASSSCHLSTSFDLVARCSHQLAFSDVTGNPSNQSAFSDFTNQHPLTWQPVPPTTSQHSLI